MNREDEKSLAKRDTEICQIFDALTPSNAGTEDCTAADLEAHEQEVLKRADCSLERLNQAIKRVAFDKTHPYWKTL